jgi:hypothetical protein
MSLKPPCLDALLGDVAATTGAIAATRLTHLSSEHVN